MNKKRTRLAIGVAIMVVFLLASGLLSITLRDNASGKTAVQATLPPPQDRHFTLYIRPGVLKMPDGQKIQVFGFTDNPNGPAKVPGPTIMVDEGDTVFVTLINDHDPTKTTFTDLGVSS